MRASGRACIGMLVGTLCAVFASAALGHDVEALSTPQVELHWSFEPWVVACLGVSLIAYLAGIARLWSHAGAGRGTSWPRALSFLVGWVCLGVALVSPLDALGSQLFSAHMVQHELLMAVVAPLMVMGRPLGVWTWALPMAARRAVGAGFHHPLWRCPWQWLTAPLAAWVLHAAALWLWHVPGWFEAALRSNVVHAWQHLSFLLSALLFWWAVLGQVSRQAQGTALVYLFTTMLHTGALGALLALSPMVWYPSYLSTAAGMGWDALDDQQLGGLVMWAPAGLAYLVAGLALAARLLRTADALTPTLSQGERG